MGWSVDYATSNPSYIALLSNWTDTNSAYSTNGGQTWTPYANFPALVGSYIGGAIAASTPDNVVFATANNGDVYYSKNATSGAATWTKILAATWGHGVQQADGVVNPGWGFAYYAGRKSLCADRVNSSTFYIFNSQTDALGGGFYRTTDGGDTWSQRNSQFVSGNDRTGFDNQLVCVFGKAGHLFYSGGQGGSSLYHSRDGGASWPSSSTYTAITGPQGTPTNVYLVTVGAIKQGNDYPSVYMYGLIGSTLSLWRSDNTSAQWAAGTAITWTDMGIPLNTMNHFSTIAADQNVWNKLYTGGHNVTMFYYNP